MLAVSVSRLSDPSCTFILLMEYVRRCLAMCNGCREALASKSAPAKHRCPCCRQSFVPFFLFKNQKLIRTPFQCGRIFEDLHSLEEGNINHVFIYDRCFAFAYVKGQTTLYVSTLPFVHFYYLPLEFLQFDELLAPCN